MTRTARRSRHCRKTGAASIRASGRIGIRSQRQRKWLLARGAILLCRPSVAVRALLDHHDAVTMVTPAAMPATVVVHLGVGAIPAVVMTTALDDDGPGAGDRRQRHRHRT